ncbi:MAG: tRNA adenosine(34) deaminase TadA [Terriglobia bacterium]
MSEDIHFMEQALAEARQAEEEGEVPVGAVVVAEGEVLARAHNRPVAASDPTAHAEILALRVAAARRGNYRLTGCTLYVTLEPCAMCAAALVHARIARLVYAAADPKAGAVQSCLRLLEAPHLNHRVEVEAGILAEEAAALLQRFFALRRAAQKPEPDS